MVLDFPQDTWWCSYSIFPYLPVCEHPRYISWQNSVFITLLTVFLLLSFTTLLPHCERNLIFHLSNFQNPLLHCPAFSFKVLQGYVFPDIAPISLSFSHSALVFPLSFFTLASTHKPYAGHRQLIHTASLIPIPHIPDPSTEATHKLDVERIGFLIYSSHHSLP